MPRTTLGIVALIVMIVLTLLAVPAGATVVFYTNRAAWEAATSGIYTLTTINFEGLATPSVPGNYSTAGGLTINGINIVGVNSDGGNFLMAYDSATGGAYDWGSGDYLVGSGWGSGYIQVTLPSGTTAVAANLMTFNSAGSNAVMTLSTGESSQIQTSSRPNWVFLGAISDVPITTVQFSAAGNYTGLDDFRYGSSSLPADETPEPDTLIFGATGLAGLWLARRLRRFC